MNNIFKQNSRFGSLAEEASLTKDPKKNNKINLKTEKIVQKMKIIHLKTQLILSRVKVIHLKSRTMIDLK